MIQFFIPTGSHETFGQMSKKKKIKNRSQIFSI